VRGKGELMNRKWMIDMTLAGAKLLVKALSLAAESESETVRLVVTSEEGVEIMVQAARPAAGELAWRSTATLGYNGDTLGWNFAEVGHDPKTYGSVLR
jgi:hypothetical protein